MIDLFQVIHQKRRRDQKKLTLTFFHECDQFCYSLLLSETSILGDNNWHTIKPGTPEHGTAEYGTPA